MCYVLSLPLFKLEALSCGYWKKFWNAGDRIHGADVADRGPLVGVEERVGCDWAEVVKNIITIYGYSSVKSLLPAGKSMAELVLCPEGKTQLDLFFQKFVEFVRSCQRVTGSFLAAHVHTYTPPPPST